MRRFVAPEGGGGSAEPRIKASLLQHLLQCDYATNIRELDALLWRAMAASPGDAIEWPRAQRARPPGDAPPPVPLPVPPPVPLKGATPSEGAGEAPEAPEPSEPSEPSEADIRASLEVHQGNIVRTAQALGLSSRYVLYRLMRKHGIRADTDRDGGAR